MEESGVEWRGWRSRVWSGGEGGVGCGLYLLLRVSFWVLLGVSFWVLLLRCLSENMKSVSGVQGGE